MLENPENKQDFFFLRFSSIPRLASYLPKGQVGHHFHSACALNKRIIDCTLFLAVLCSNLDNSHKNSTANQIDKYKDDQTK